MTKSTIFFVLFSISNLLAIFWLGYFDIYSWIASKDITYISFLIGVVYMATLLSFFFEIRSGKNSDDVFELQMFIANHLPALGLLGTVIGLMISVESISTIKIDPNEQTEIIEMMQNIFLALSTALLTTIVGLITSLLLKGQLVVMNMVHSHEVE